MIVSFYLWSTVATSRFLIIIVHAVFGRILAMHLRGVEAHAWPVLTHACNMCQVCRGTAVMLVAPTDGTEEIANPFLSAEAPVATA